MEFLGIHADSRGLVKFERASWGLRGVRRRTAEGRRGSEGCAQDNSGTTGKVNSVDSTGQSLKGPHLSFSVLLSSERDMETLDSILENGPYFCGGKHIVIKKWHPGMHLTKGAFSSVPVWVKLYNVPLESWTEDGLSYIASYISNPLYLDFTQNHSQLTFAHVCIEVEAAKEIPKSFVVSLGYERIFKERVGNEDTVWEEVKRKKDHRSPPSLPLVTSSPCHSGVSSDVLRKDDMGNVPLSVVVSSSYFDVLKSCDSNDYSCVMDQVSYTSPIVPILGRASKKQEVPEIDPVAPIDLHGSESLQGFLWKATS
ncbi:hypothetical protein RHMOL_Rhmol02G0169700 [Rhododendron molle]|uniref:Uncharacterized protein n=1 Tax=Rhododendron molle TaxID=49168 RepID=A0ACC0PST1_RHOML|nr:hypothetical protein RHMOL_Rhmol02G0169700 [Rhododendron molle]